MGFNAQRITEARQIRGLNIAQLAQKLDVTRQSVFRYESGGNPPQARILDRMCEILEVPIDFFYKESMPFHTESTVFFRSLKSADAGLRTAIEWKCRWSGEAYFYLENYLNMPKLNLPVTDFILNKPEYSHEDIEYLANYAREYWGLGLEPISSVMPLLEKNGIVISNGKIDNPKADACSKWIDGRPIIFMGSNPLLSGSTFRQNFTLAHELGHLLMHSHVTQDDIQSKELLDRTEREANYFAGCLLMPSEAFSSDVYSPSLNFYLSLKSRWHVSISAMIYRSHELDLITDSNYQYLYKQISINKWRKVEPLDTNVPMQFPKLFMQALKMLLNANILNYYDIRNYFKWHDNDIEEIFCLPPNFFNRDDNQEIPLSIIH